MAILDSVGARAVGAQSGADAVEHLRRQDFDLIVSDLNLPGEITGKDLYRWAASNRKSGTHGFLFVTGDTLGEAAFLEEVRSRCLLKPFSMEEYLTTLREAWHELQTAA
jgi:CheY-like chemotaxis protein